MLKKVLITTLVIFGLGAGLYQGAKSWVRSVIPEKAHFQKLKQTQTQDLPYVTENIPDNRGKILAVVTSTDSMGEDKSTGYEHTELARAYWVFIANGFEVDIASPKGGKAPVVLDGEDMGAYDYAFLNDSSIQATLENTLPLNSIDPADYEAVYYVGGKGTMFDFPQNKDIQRITKAMYQQDKVVSAVCHGPAALVNVQLDDGNMLLANKQVTGFTNQEELLLIPDAEEVFPFLLEDKLVAQGAKFQAGQLYLEQVSHDGKLITGQNPWSVWPLAELVVKELGYEPKPRIITPEEHSVAVLMTYHNDGLEAAKAQLEQNPEAYHRLLFLMHGMVAFMQFDVSTGLDMISLMQELKSQLAA